MVWFYFYLSLSILFCTSFGALIIFGLENEEDNNYFYWTSLFYCHPMVLSKENNNINMPPVNEIFIFIFPNPGIACLFLFSCRLVSLPLFPWAPFFWLSSLLDFY